MNKKVIQSYNFYNFKATRTCEFCGHQANGNAEIEEQEYWMCGVCSSAWEKDKDSSWRG